MVRTGGGEVGLPGVNEWKECLIGKGAVNNASSLLLIVWESGIGARGIHQRIAFLTGFLEVRVGEGEGCTANSSFRVGRRVVYIKVSNDYRRERRIMENVLRCNGAFMPHMAVVDIVDG